MATDVWLPQGFCLADGATIGQPLESGADWQIFATNGPYNVLLARPELAKKWDDGGFLALSLFTEIVFGETSFFCLHSPKTYVLASVANCPAPHNEADALAFAYALGETRKLSADKSFHDALYVEQYSRLLPTWTLTPEQEDELVLGSWLSGGVSISTHSFRRLHHLTGWLPVASLAKITRAAGLAVPADAAMLSKSRRATSQDNEAIQAPAKKKVAKDQPEVSASSVKTKEFHLPGRPQLEAFFNEHVLDIIFNADKYQALGIDFPGAIILYGPPGCGKTFAVEKLVEFIDWPSYSIDSSSIGSPYIHETGKKIAEVFEKAMDDAPSILVIDEMESFLTDRNKGVTSGLHHVEEVAEFLRRIPEAIKNHVLIIAMTNMIDMIDPAILRRGRFDHIIEVGMPSKEEVSSLLDSLLYKLPKNRELNLDMLVSACTGRALSDAAFVVREAARLAARSGKSSLDQDSLDAALNSLPHGQEKKKRRVGFIRDDE